MAQVKTMNRQGGKFKFKWWMGVLVVGVIVAIGVLVRVLSHAGGSGGPYNVNRAYVLHSDHEYLTIVKLKQYDYGKIFDPASSAYVEENWIYMGNYPKAAGTYKANTVPRWIKQDTITNGGYLNPVITPNTVCATLQKVIKQQNGVKSLTSPTATPPLTKGDNIDLITTSDCSAPAQG